MKNEDYQDLLCKMAAAAYTETEGERIEQEIAEANRLNPPDPNSPILANALAALKKQQREQEQAARRKRLSRNLARAAAVVLAAGIGGGMLITNVDAFRVPVLNFFADHFDRYTAVHLEPDDAELTEITEIPWENAYAPTVLPEGYKLVDAENLQGQILFLIYSNGVPGMEIRLDQCAPGVNAAIDTEGVPIHNIKINGYDGFWCNKYNTIQVVWNNGKFVFVLDLPDVINNFVEIAESVQIVK